MEDKVTRVGASERGQQTSFNGDDGTSDIKGKIARIATSKLGNERISNSTSAALTIERFNGSRSDSPIDRFTDGNGKRLYSNIVQGSRTSRFFASNGATGKFNRGDQFREAS